MYIYIIHFSCVKICFRETVCRIIEPLMSSPTPPLPCQKVLFFAAHKSFLELCSSGGTVHSRVPAFSLATKASAQKWKNRKPKKNQKQSFSRPTCLELKLSTAPFQTKSSAVITFAHWPASLV